MTICVKCIVTGRVQGVFYRASTRHEAQSLGVSGYVRNLADGSVEVLACGPKDVVEKLRAWLAKGPTHARVSQVVCELAELDMASRYTSEFCIE